MGGEPEERPVTRTKRQKTIRALRNASKSPRPNCPTPHKRGYGFAEAVHMAVKQSKNHKPNRIYPCKCGKFHITTKAQKDVKHD